MMAIILKAKVKRQGKSFYFLIPGAYIKNKIIDPEKEYNVVAEVENGE